MRTAVSIFLARVVLDDPSTKSSGENLVFRISILTSRKVRHVHHGLSFRTAATCSLLSRLLIQTAKRTTSRYRQVDERYPRSRAHTRARPIARGYSTRTSPVRVSVKKQPDAPTGDNWRTSPTGRSSTGANLNSSSPEWKMKRKENTSRSRRRCRDRCPTTELGALRECDPKGIKGGHQQTNASSLTSKISRGLRQFRVRTA